MTTGKAPFHLHGESGENTAADGVESKLNQGRKASGTMIILDPDLDPDPAPSLVTLSAASGLTAIRPAKIAPQQNLRLPTVRTLARFLSVAQIAVRLKGQVNVLLTTDTAIRRLNRQFRGKNKATDVLSFPAMNVPGSKSAEALAGDLAVSVPMARKQAIAQGHSLSTEIKVLILHGLLHLAGYDHETDTGQMARREAKLRASLRLPLGLIERTEVPAMRTAAKGTSGAKALVDSAAFVEVRVETLTCQSCPDTKRGLKA